MTFTDTELTAALPDIRRYCHSVARRIKNARTTGDDLLQDTVEKALRARESFETGSSLFAWMCTIATNKALSDARRGWRQGDIGDNSLSALEPFVVACSAGLDPVRTLELKQTIEALDRLPPNMRDSLREAAIYGRPYDEIATAQGVAEGTVKSRVSRARAGLAEEMAMPGEGPRSRAKPHQHVRRGRGPLAGTQI